MGMICTLLKYSCFLVCIVSGNFKVIEDNYTGVNIDELASTYRFVDKVDSGAL